MSCLSVLWWDLSVFLTQFTSCCVVNSGACVSGGSAIAIPLPSELAIADILPATSAILKRARGKIMDDHMIWNNKAELRIESAIRFCVVCICIFFRYFDQNRSDQNHQKSLLHSVRYRNPTKMSAVPSPHLYCIITGLFYLHKAPGSPVYHLWQWILYLQTLPLQQSNSRNIQLNHFRGLKQTL